MIEGLDINYERNISCVYIYNLHQAYFYIKNGRLPLKIDKHFKTGKIFFVFDKLNTEEVYSAWCNKKYTKQILEN